MTESIDVRERVMDAIDEWVGTLTPTHGLLDDIADKIIEICRSAKVRVQQQSDCQHLHADEGINETIELLIVEAGGGPLDYRRAFYDGALSMHFSEKAKRSASILDLARVSLKTTMAALFAQDPGVGYPIQKGYLNESEVRRILEASGVYVDA